VSWVEILAAFAVCHAVGDFLLQTEWQARTKPRGLGRDPAARRALCAHVATYTLAFVPALVWIGAEHTALGAVGLGALIALPHLVVDDGRVVRAWLGRVKHVPGATGGLVVAVDQSMHVVCLFAVALLPGA
jgi:4-hydroxybenzoate polyprenyltransferase